MSPWSLIIVSFDYWILYFSLFPEEPNLMKLDETTAREIYFMSSLEMAKSVGKTLG